MFIMSRLFRWATLNNTSLSQGNDEYSTTTDAILLYMLPNPISGMTDLEAAVVKMRLDNPKMSKADIGTAIFGTTNRIRASQRVSDILRRPRIQTKLAEHNELFEAAIVGTVRDWKDSETPRKREIALDAAKFGYEANNGKATVKVDTKSTVVLVSIDLDTKDQKTTNDIIDLETQTT